MHNSNNISTSQTSGRGRWFSYRACKSEYTFFAAYAVIIVMQVVPFVSPYPSGHPIYFVTFSFPATIFPVCSLGAFRTCVFQYGCLDFEASRICYSYWVIVVQRVYTHKYFHCCCWFIKKLLILNWEGNVCSGTEFINFAVFKTTHMVIFAVQDWYLWKSSANSFNVFRNVPWHRLHSDQRRNEPPTSPSGSALINGSAFGTLSGLFLVQHCLTRTTRSLAKILSALAYLHCLNVVMRLLLINKGNRWRNDEEKSY